MKQWRKAGIIIFWLLLWELFAGLVNNSFLLVGPIESVKALSRLLQKQEFYGILWKSSWGILSAYLLSFLLALILSYLSYRNSLLEDFLKPGVFVLRSLPVASFIIILLFFLGRDKLSFTISGFMSFPIFYINLLEGFHKTDYKLLEMAEVFHFSLYRRLRYIHLPAVYPLLLGAAKLAMGLSWKSGIAAELIGQVGKSIGYQLMEAKVSLEMADVFAWSIMIIALSQCWEILVILLIKGLCRKGCA